jgi:NodT family efflux transporter outer membrane factor (OMF) lipoprotein
MQNNAKSRPSRLLRTAAVGLLACTGCTTVSEYIHNCFKVGPNYKRPVAPVAQDWIDASDPRVREDPEEHRHWWSTFNDPALDALICSAFQQNITLREAAFRVLEERAQLGIAIGELFPQTQNAVGSYQRINLSKEVANRQFIAEAYYNQWNFGAGLVWELDFWGRYRRAVEAQLATLDASIENYDDVLVILLGDVGVNYVLYRTYQQQIEYLRTNVALQRETLTIAQARFKAGQATELDPDQAQSTLSQTEAQIPQVEIQLREANNRLCILLGMPPIDLGPKLGKAPIPTTPTDVAVGIPCQLLQRRPDVREAERLAAAQCAEIGVAEANLYPTVTITGQFGVSAEVFKDLFRGNAVTGQLVPGFNWNILNYGRLINGVRVQDAKFQELVAKYQQTALTAAEEVENALVTFLKSQERSKYLAESVAAAKDSVRIVVAQYKAGMADFNRVSLLEQDLVNRQNLYAEAQGQVASGLVQVYRALGGGWQIRCDGCTVPPLPVEPATTTPGKSEDIVPQPRPAPGQKEAFPPKEQPAIETK